MVIHNLSPRVVPVAAAALLTGLAASTLNKMRLTGNGPPYLKLGTGRGRVVYEVDALSEWLASKRRRSTSELPNPAA